MSRSNSDTEPASGESSPVIRLNSVVFPAPLGPMMSRRSPGSTDRLTPAVTRRPPNDLSRSFTASAVIVGGDYPTALTCPGPMPRTRPSQGGNTGSNPVGATIELAEIDPAYVVSVSELGIGK